MTNKVMHENDNYKVVVTEDPETKLPTYGLVNKSSGVVEEYTPVLPEIKIHAEQFDSYEKQEMYKQYSYQEEVEERDNITPFRH